MSSRGREVEVTISSAKNIKNVNWRNGPNKPYAIVWIDPKYKYSTRVDEEDDTSPSWNQTFVIPLPHDVDDEKLYIDVVHAGGEENTKPLIGSANLKLRDVIDDVGFGVPLEKTLKLKRPSGRPHGKLDVTVTVKEPRYKPAPGSYHAPPYGYTHAPPQHVYGEPYGNTHAPPQPVYGDPYAPPPHGYGDPYAPPQPYGNAAYGQPGYGYTEEKKKESKFGGMGTGLAVGAVAGVLGGVAIAEGLDALEDDEAEEAAEDVEEDDAGDDDGDF